MLIPRHLCIILCMGMGLGYYSKDVQASEPSIYSKMLTPSPLGKDRILAVCLPQKNDIKTLLQFYKSVNWDEFSARQLVVVEVSTRIVKSVSVDDYSEAELGNGGSHHHDFNNKLRRKVGCKTDLEFVLIGKDTGVKKRWKESVPQGELFEVIDAMPMRQYEMRQRTGKN